MRIAWATDVQGIGDAYGFTYGNRYGKACLEDAGVTIDPDAPIALHHCPPHSFKPIPGKINVLWTAWEFSTLPPWETETLGQADAVFVTARFLADVFRQYVNCPVEYVQQGIDTSRFFPRPRSYRPKPFRVLWVGAPNDRKGHQFVTTAWGAFAGNPRMELYLKTTGTGRFEQHGNIVFDSRDLPGEEMVRLYHSADLFAFPSMAEGFGFTLGEAMACGIPCIAPRHTSLADITTPHCILNLAYRETGERFKLELPGEGQFMVEAAEPDVNDLAPKIDWAYQHKAKARKIGRKGAAYIARNFTWRHAGRRLRAALRRVAQANLQEAA